MLKRLFLYFAVVFVLVVLATTLNRYVLDKKQSVEQAFETGRPLFKKVTDNIVADFEKGIDDTRSVSSDGIQEPDPAFKSWFKTEAKLVDSASVDLRAKEQELETATRSLGPKEVGYLKKTTLNISSPQVERILSTYLLTRGGESAQQALIDIASRPLRLEPAEPHSLKEIENNKERAIDMMLIDSIAESSREINERIRILQEIVQKKEDLSVKNYAQRKIEELKNL